MKEFFGWLILAAPQYAPVGIILLVTLLVVIQRVGRMRRALEVLQPRGNATRLVHHASLAHAIVKALLILIGMLFLWFALLRPQWNKKEETVMQEGRDLMIALDVSRSMLATDVIPNRLELTKKKIHDLVNKLSCDRVGLILFSGTAVVQCPLTNDYSAFFMFLDQVNVETISSGSTAIEGALQKALMLFKQGASRKNKLLLLFTDGEDFSTSLASVRRAIKQDKVILFTLGVGTQEGSPIPLFDQKGKQIGHQKNNKGSVVISRLNSTLLQDLARETGGHYLQLNSQDDSDIATLVSQVSGFEKEKFDDKKMSQFEDQYPYFLMVSFFCFALEWLL